VHAEETYGGEFISFFYQIWFFQFFKFMRWRFSYIFMHFCQTVYLILLAVKVCFISSQGQSWPVGGPMGSTFAGPNLVVCAEIFAESHQVIIIIVETMIDVKERGPKRVSGSMPFSFISPTKTLHVRTIDISVTPCNKSLITIQ